MDGRDLTVLIVVGVGVLYFAIAFGVTWLRASRSERQRWHYRGHHDGGGGLLPDPPEDPVEWLAARRLLLLSGALALGGVAAGAVLIRLEFGPAGVVIFGIMILCSGIVRVAYSRRVGLMPYRGDHRTNR